MPELMIIWKMEFYYQVRADILLTKMRVHSSIEASTEVPPRNNTQASRSMPYCLLFC